MATQRLESGQMQVRSVGGVPMAQVGLQQVDNIGYRAQASTAQSLSQVLDRMGSQLFEEAGRQVQQRAFADVANNRISDEQLEAAKQGDVSMLKLGGTFNMYDIAVRKARSFELAGRFEMEAKNEAVKIMADIEAGNMDSTQAATKLNTLTAGYGKSLASVDPDAALKFNASMGVYGSTIVAKAYEHEQRRRKQQQAIMLEGSLANDMKLIPAVLEQGVFTDDKGVTRSATEFLDVYRKNLSDRAFAAGGLETAQHYLGKFDKEVQQQKINVLSKHFIGEGGEIDANKQVARLMAGDAGKMSHVLQDMIATDFDSVVKIEAQIYAASGHRHQAEQQRQADQKRAGEAQAVSIMTQIYSLPEGDPKRKSLSVQLANVARNAPGSVPMGIIKDVLSPNQESDPRVLFNAKDAIFSGKITDTAQIWEMTKNGLGKKDAANLVSLFYSEDRKDAATLERGLAKIAGINVTPGMPVLFDPKGAEAVRLNDLRSRALTMQAKSASEGKPITSNEILRTIEEQIFKERNTNEALQAKATLEKSYATKPWVGGEITRDKLTALEQKHKEDRNKMQDIERMRKLLDQSEGKK